MKIGIVGVGNVGSAVRHGLTRIGHEVFIFDVKMPETTLAQTHQRLLYMLKK